MNWVQQLKPKLMKIDKHKWKLSKQNMQKMELRTHLRLILILCLSEFQMNFFISFFSKDYLRTIAETEDTFLMVSQEHTKTANTLS